MMTEINGRSRITQFDEQLKAEKATATRGSWRSQDKILGINNLSGDAWSNGNGGSVNMVAQRPLVAWMPRDVRRLLIKGQ